MSQHFWFVLRLLYWLMSFSDHIISIQTHHLPGTRQRRGVPRCMHDDYSKLFKGVQKWAIHNRVVILNLLSPEFVINRYQKFAYLHYNSWIAIFRIFHRMWALHDWQSIISTNGLYLALYHDCNGTGLIGKPSLQTYCHCNELRTLHKVKC